ncbi:MAG TPA: signal peptidase II [Chitinophagales bacterium]|nr:signal peptidase II [Chitinophagales bacterium]
MRAKKTLRAIIIVAVLLSNIGCDQISKTIVRRTIDYNQKIGMVSNYLTLTRVENSGAFLSVGNSLSNPIKIILLSIFPLVAIGCALLFLVRSTDISKITLIGLSFIIGGGIGNIYDRIVHGSVTDFLHINFVIFQTGIFNMADLSIMMGTFLILAQSFFKLTRVIPSKWKG